MFETISPPFSVCYSINILNPVTMRSPDLICRIIGQRLKYYRDGNTSKH